MRATSATSHASAWLDQVAAVVWLPDLASPSVALASAPYHIHRVVLRPARLDPGMACVTALSVAFIAGRALFGHLPDRIGGAKVALVCLLTKRWPGADLASASSARLWQALR